MDELLKLVPEIFKQNGLVGILALLWAYREFYVPHKKKKDGTWISWEEIDVRLESMEKKLNGHLEAEAREDIMFAEMKQEQKFIRERFDTLKEMFEKLEVHQQKSFDLISSMKDTLLRNQ